MAAAERIPFKSRGRALVVLVALKDHPRRIYHYSKTGGEEYSWAIRDYLIGARVRSGDSTMTASQIEDLVDHAEQAPSCPVERIDFWSGYCTKASERHFGTGNVDSTTPNPSTLGEWKGIRKNVGDMRENVPKHKPDLEAPLWGAWVIVFENELCHLSCQRYSYAIRRLHGRKWIELERVKKGDSGANEAHMQDMLSRVRVIEKNARSIGNIDYWERRFRDLRNDHRGDYG